MTEIFNQRSLPDGRRIRKVRCFRRSLLIVTNRLWIGSTFSVTSRLVPVSESLNQRLAGAAKE
jgi:hypothetical protein